MPALDHIAIAAPDLASGMAHVRNLAGVAMSRGGAHPRMATHNVLVRTGGQTYLEIIAPDPDAPRPAHPRWFGLDAMEPDAKPRLAVWVMAVDNLDEALATARRLGVDLGEPVEMTRGQFAWRLSVPQDGSLPLGGAAPVLIEWPDGINPSNSMEDAGLTLKELQVSSPEADRIAALCDALGGLPEKVALSSGSLALTACLQSETGEVWL